MVQRQIEKVVTSQLLEATRDVLDHLRKWQNHLSQSGEELPEGLSRIYGSVRRLRDYLHRLGVSSYTNEVQVNLSDEDMNLLVSCAVHHIGTIECDLHQGVPNADDRAWLESVGKSLADWAVKLASQPVERIPTDESVRTDTPIARGVITAIANSTAGVGAARSGAHPSAGPVGALRSDGTPPPVVHGAGAPPARVPAPAPSKLDALPSFLSPSTQPAKVAPNPSQTGSQAGPAPVPSTPTFSWQPAESPTPAIGAMDPDPAATRPQQPPAELQPATDRPVAPLLDPRLLRDPQLRTIVTMDAQAFERTASGAHYRLAMVHLSSILEGAVVDFAIPRQKQLGIGGLPESWSLEVILERCLGERLTSMDRPFLVQLVAARHLVRPAVQLNSPMVVTASIVEKAAEFVRRVMADLGYAGAQSPMATHPVGQDPALAMGAPNPSVAQPGMGQPRVGGLSGATPLFPGVPSQPSPDDPPPPPAPLPPWAHPGR